MSCILFYIICFGICFITLNDHGNKLALITWGKGGESKWFKHYRVWNTIMLLFRLLHIVTPNIVRQNPLKKLDVTVSLNWGWQRGELYKILWASVICENKQCVIYLLIIIYFKSNLYLWRPAEWDQQIWINILFLPLLSF